MKAIYSEEIFDGVMRGSIPAESVSFDGIYGQNVPDTPRDIDAAIRDLKAALEEYKNREFDPSTSDIRREQ